MPMYIYLFKRYTETNECMGTCKFISVVLIGTFRFAQAYIGTVRYIPGACTVKTLRICEVSVIS